MANWEIVDNFLSKEDFEKILSVIPDKITDDIPDNAVKSYPHKIDKTNTASGNLLSEDLIKTLKNNYHEKALNILRKLNPKKVELYDFSEFSVVRSGKNAVFPIHDDTPDKILTGAIYLYPEKNIGTFFYSNKKGKDKRTVEWKQNRAVFFSRKERESWHSYESDGLSSRFVLTYKFKTKRLKDVFKVEDKSYLMGLFRFKINPYLFRYFNFTI